MVGICIFLTLTVTATAAGGKAGARYGLEIPNGAVLTDTLPRNPARSEPDGKGLENGKGLEKSFQGNSENVKGKLKDWKIKEVPRAKPQAVPRIVTPPGLMKPKIIKPKIITKGIGR